MKSMLRVGEGNSKGYQGMCPLTWKVEPGFSRKRIVTAY